MKKSKTKKVLKTIFWIIFIIFILFWIYTLRNFFIIKRLQRNASIYADSNNYHSKAITQEPGNIKMTIDYYKKNNQELIILERNNNGEIVKMSVYNNGKSKDMFIETKDSKQVKKNIDSFLIVNLSNSLETENNFQTFLASMLAIIRTEKINNKNCYVINNLISATNLVESGTQYIYIDKETGLIAKTIVNDIESIREYEFDCVNDNIFIEPNINEYTLIEH